MLGMTPEGNGANGVGHARVHKLLCFSSLAWNNNNIHFP